MLNFIKRRLGLETRASGSGFTAEVIRAREAYVAGRTGLADLTATVQSCATLWESGLGIASVTGTDMLGRRVMALIGRALALRGECVFLVDGDRLIPASDWELSTRYGAPSAYRLSLPEVGGGTTRTALAAEVLHVRTGVDVAAPWAGQAPLRRAQLTAGLLNALESALAETYETAPLGSLVLPMPEMPATDLDSVARGFRGARGKVLLRESVNVAAAGGPAPAQDWRPSDLTPDLERAMTTQSLDAARNAILGVYGVLPALMEPNATGLLVREGQRHLAQWVLQPLAEGIAEEASGKLGGPVQIDVMQPLQAFDAGGRARAAAQIVQAMAMAKEAGIDPEKAMRLVGWETEGEGNA